MEKKIVVGGLGLFLALAVAGVSWPAPLPGEDAPIPGASPGGRDPLALETPALTPDGGEPSFPQGEAPRSVVADSGAASGASLLVRLRFRDGAPAGGVGVGAGPDPDPRRDPSGAPVDFARRIADARGEVRFGELGPGPVLVCVDGSDLRRVELATGAETVVTFDLAPGARVAGRVVDAAGAPVAGASIWLSAGAGWWSRQSDGSRWNGSVVATSEPSGAFVLRDVRGLDRWIGARGDGHAPSLVHLLRREDDTGQLTDQLALTLVLPGRAASLRGRVLDEAGLPIAGACIRIGSARGLAWEMPRPLSAGTEPPPLVALVSDSAGRFACGGLRPGVEPVLVTSQGYVRFAELLSLAPDETAELTAVLTPSTSVRGVVRDPEGKPLQHVTVVASGRARHEQAETSTNPRGEFVLEDLAREGLLLRTRASAWREARTALVAGDARELRWDPVLLPVLVLRGRLVGARQEPLPRRSIFLEADEGSGTHRTVTTTDGEGRFRVSPCVDAAYRIRAGPDEMRFSLALSCSPLVRPGGWEVDVTLSDAPPAGFFVGVLLDAAGIPVGGASICVVQKGAAFFRANAKTEKGSGSFRIGPLPEGIYGLVLRDPAPQRPVVSVTGLALAADESKDLGLLRQAPSGRLTPRARFADGALPKRAECHIRSDPDGADHGSMSAGGSSMPLAAARYLVQVHGDGFAPQEKACVIEVGKETRLDFVLERAVEREVLFEAPEPAGWESARRLRIEITQEDGGVVIRRDFADEEVPPFRFPVWLAPGRYRTTLQVDDRRPVAGGFAIASLARSLEPVRVRPEVSAPLVR